MKEKFDVQVSKDHYNFNDYDDLPRFISYFYQIDSSISLKPKSILIVGIGNNLVGNYLSGLGFKVTTCDFDKSLKPDYVADIRKLPFKDNSFDLVLACEILEHISFEKDVDIALKELRRVSKKNVIISIPYSCFSFELISKFHIPFLSRLLNFSLKIPYTFIKTKLGGEHYWEMGRRFYSKRVVRNKLKRYFNIKNEFQPIINHYHYFFILEKYEKK